MSDDIDLGNLAITITDGEPAEAKFDLPNGTSITRTFPESGTINMRLGLGLSLSHQRPPAGGGGGGDPAWIESLRSPGGDLPLFAAKFTTGEYWLNGASAVVGDLFTGANFNPAAIGASGISPTTDGVNDFANPQIPLFAAAALAHMSSGNFTFLARVSGGASTIPRLFCLMDNVDYNSATNQIVVEQNAELAKASDWDSLNSVSAAGSWPADAVIGIAGNILQDVGGGNYETVLAANNTAPGAASTTAYAISAAIAALGISEDINDPVSASGPTQAGEFYITHFAVWAIQPQSDSQEITTLTA